MPKVNIIWFRRDLRLHDNAALFNALKSGNPVIPIFIFDKNILDQLEDKSDRRVEFIHAALEEMQQQLVELGASLEVYYGTPLEIFKQLVAKYAVEQVFANHDYEPYAKKRDGEVADFLQQKEVPFYTFKDQVIFEKEEILTGKGTPYTVFTPYSKSWQEKLHSSKEKNFFPFGFITF